jgi:large subunit ribosomal protein L22
MEAIAKTRHLKGSPRKARLVIDLIRGRNVSHALNILKFTDKRAADPIAKTLRSAIANATNLAERQNIAIDPDDLFVKTCFVDMGAHKNRRRMRPAPQGRAFREQRHYCHITILVSSDVPKAKEDEGSRKKGKKLLAKEAAQQGTEQKAKAPAKPKAEKKAPKVEQAKEETLAPVAATIPTPEVQAPEKAQVEEPKIVETVETKAPVVEEQTQTETAPVAEPEKVEQPNVETVKEPAVKEETVAEAAPKTTAPVEEPKAAPIEEVKTEAIEQPVADTKVETKSAQSETSDLLEIETAKADADASNAKNVVSQTPAERNETKEADERKLDENDILELQ